MFSVDIIAWCLREDGDMVQEIHLLKSRKLLCGPVIPKWKWEAAQRRMYVPYPASLRKPVDVVLMEAV